MASANLKKFFATEKQNIRRTFRESIVYADCNNVAGGPTTVLCTDSDFGFKGK